MLPSRLNLAEYSHIFIILYRLRINQSCCLTVTKKGRGPTNS